METIDECLSVRAGHLFMEDCDTTQLIQRYGSPLFVYSEDQLRRNLRRFQRAFSDCWPDGPVDILPANKANWTTAIRAILTQEGAGADIYSEGELHSALACGTSPEKISVNGGGKSDAMLAHCIEAGVRITVEDLDEPARINRIAGELGKKAAIRFRVKPDFPSLWRKTDFAAESVSIDMGIQVYKSGIPAQYLEALGRETLKLQHLELMGLHFHGGRHHASLWYWRRLMTHYGQLVARLCKAWNGYRPKELDIGGGFALHRDPHSKLGVRNDTLLTYLAYPLEVAMHALRDNNRYRAMSTMVEKFMVKTPSRFRSPSIEDYASAAVGSFRESLLAGGVDLSGVRLQLEPGRSLYGDIGIHLASVKKFKQQTEPLRMNWVLTDTTYFFLSGGVYEQNLHDFRIANKADWPARHVADIVGHSCYADRILPLVKVPDIVEGDLVAFFDMGAYQEVSASNFNALPRPAVVLVSGDRSALIKRAETIDDVYRRDLLPEHLQTWPTTSSAVVSPKTHTGAPVT